VRNHDAYDIMIMIMMIMIMMIMMIMIMIMIMMPQQLLSAVHSTLNRASDTGERMCGMMMRLCSGLSWFVVGGVSHLFLCSFSIWAKLCQQCLPCSSWYCVLYVPCWSCSSAHAAGNVC
jgi:hypothetical protein